MQQHNTHYKHLNQEKRVEIYSLIQLWLSFRRIGPIIWVHHTTVSREVKRNSMYYWRGVYKYKPIQAEKKYKKRRTIANHKHIKLIKDHSLSSKIFSLLTNKSLHWSPDEILWRLKLEWRTVVSTSTLYRYIYNNTDRKRFLLHKGLKYKKKYKNKSRGNIPGVPKIDERNPIVEDRNRIGDWEIDTVVSKWHKWWVFTAAERMSKYYLIYKVHNLKSETLLNTMLYCFYWHTLLTVTSDNWVEFAKFSQFMKKTNSLCYTAHPYSSYERWTNENSNWLIRRFIPKGCTFSDYSDEYIAKIQHMINHKPRKILNYRTPHEVYYNTNLTYL